MKFIYHCCGEVEGCLQDSASKMQAEDYFKFNLKLVKSESDGGWRERDSTFFSEGINLLTIRHIMTVRNDEIVLPVPIINSNFRVESSETERPLFFLT